MSGAPDPRITATPATPVDWEQLAAFMRQMLVALDGLWFMNVLKQLGPEATLAMDVRVMVSQFKKATRLWRQLARLDGRSASDKASVFQAMAHLYGHQFEILTSPGEVTMRISRCAFYENLKKAGRTGDHDCRELCRRLAPEWFAEIEPRTNGAGRVDLTLPVGGPHCDWSVAQPADPSSPGSS